MLSAPLITCIICLSLCSFVFCSFSLSITPLNYVQAGLQWTNDGSIRYSVVDRISNRIIYSTGQNYCVIELENGVEYSLFVNSANHNTSLEQSFMLPQISEDPPGVTDPLISNQIPVVTAIDSTTVAVMFDAFAQIDSCEYQVIGLIKGVYKILSVLSNPMCVPAFPPSPSPSPLPNANFRLQTTVHFIPSGVPVAYKIRGGSIETLSKIFATSAVSNEHAFDIYKEFDASQFATVDNQGEIDPFVVLDANNDKLYATFDLVPFSASYNAQKELYARFVLYFRNAIEETHLFYYFNGGTSIKTFIDDDDTEELFFPNDYSRYTVRLDNSAFFYIPLDTIILEKPLSNQIALWTLNPSENDGFTIVMDPAFATSPQNALNVTDIKLHVYNGETGTTSISYVTLNGPCNEIASDEVTNLSVCKFPSGINLSNVNRITTEITGDFIGQTAVTIGKGILFDTYFPSAPFERSFISPIYNSNVGFWPSIDGEVRIYAKDPSYFSSFSITLEIQRISDLAGISASASPSLTPSRTKSMTTTPSISITPSHTRTPTPSTSLTATATVTRTSSPSSSPTPSSSSSPSSTPSSSPTPSSTKSTTPSPSPTRTASITKSISKTSTATRTPSRSSSPTRSISRSNTPSRSFTGTPTSSKSYSPSTSQTPARTNTPTPSKSYSPSPSVTATSSMTRSTSLSKTPTRSSTPFPSNSITPTSTPSTVVVIPTPSSTRLIIGLSLSSSPTPSPSFGYTPSPSQIIIPTQTPSVLPFSPCIGGNVIGCPVVPIEVIIVPEAPVNIPVETETGYQVGTVEVPLGALPDGYSVKLTPVTVDASQVVNARIVSSTIDLTAYTTDNQISQIKSSVEICLEVREGVEIDKSCLGFLDESKTPPEWVCQDSCLSSHADKQSTFCGKTTHFTSFSILLTGVSGDCGKNRFQYIFDEQWKDLTLIGCTAAGVIIILVIIALIINFAPSRVLYGDEGTRARALRLKQTRLEQTNLTGSDEEEEIV